MHSLPLKELLPQRLKGATQVVVLGVGSELRGDDAAGSMIAEKLSKKNLPKFTILTGGSAPENFTGEIRKAKPSHCEVIILGIQPRALPLARRFLPKFWQA